VVIRDASPSDLPLIREILTRSSDAPYDIAPVLEEKCFGAGASGPPRVRVYGDAGIAVSCGKYLRLLAVVPERRREGIGSALLLDSGASVIGAEPGNYFLPGVLERDAGFFIRHGYAETAVTWNLHADLWSAGDPARVPGPVLETPIDQALLDFVRQEFGNTWAFEVSRAAAGCYVPDVAFAVIEANNRGLGTFGPTGVASAHRGKGHGRTVLLAALAALARRGYTRAIIPWTDALDFYRRSCGAEPAHRFVTLTVKR
jgi:GNAT superfamily N-acetyltransferase